MKLQMGRLSNCNWRRSGILTHLHRLGLSMRSPLRWRLPTAIAIAIAASGGAIAQVSTPAPISGDGSSGNPWVVIEATNGSDASATLTPPYFGRMQQWNEGTSWDNLTVAGFGYGGGQGDYNIPILYMNYSDSYPSNAYSPPPLGVGGDVEAITDEGTYYYSVLPPGSQIPAMPAWVEGALAVVVIAAFSLFIHRRRTCLV